MRILVTGGAGYIGSHTVRALLARGHDVWVYDSLVYGHRAAVPADRLIVGDLRDADVLDHALLIHRIEAVVHFAAFAYVGESVTDPAKYYQNNVANSLTLFERMRRHGVKRLVFSSTCATYGTPDKVPITEDTPQRPINPYGRTKLMVEQAMARLRGRVRLGLHGPAVLQRRRGGGRRVDRRGPRPGDAPDPAGHPGGASKKRPHIEVFGTDYPTPDGTCIRDYIHVEDLAEAHALALEQMRAGTGSGVQPRAPAAGTASAR